jgi:hypothetical protein
VQNQHQAQAKGGRGDGAEEGRRTRGARSLVGAVGRDGGDQVLAWVQPVSALGNWWRSSRILTRFLPAIPRALRGSMQRLVISQLAEHGQLTSPLKLVQDIFGRKYAQCDPFPFSSFLTSVLQFQRYIGIPEGSGAPPKEKKKAEQKDADDDISDDDMDDNEDEDEGLDQQTGPTAANVINDRDLAGILAKNKVAATNEENLARFFDSPEKSIRVFMSSYARAQGYIW